MMKMIKTFQEIMMKMQIYKFMDSYKSIMENTCGFQSHEILPPNAVMQYDINKLMAVHMKTKLLLNIF